MKGKLKIIINELIIIFIILIGIINITFSWMERNNEPYLYESNIKITSDGSLAFILNDNEVNSISLNDYFDLNDFELKTVSSLYGYKDSFFKISYNNNELGDFVRLQKNDDTITYTEFARRNGYIDISFYLLNKNNESNKYIFISNNSSFTDANQENGTTALHTIRVCINTDEIDEENNTYLFRYSKIIPHWGVISEGPFYRENDLRNNSIVSYMYDVYTFSDFFINDEYLENGEDLDITKAICKLSPNEKRKITVRIWCEGEDPDSLEQIINESINLYLGFTGVDYED